MSSESREGGTRRNKEKSPPSTGSNVLVPCDYVFELAQHFTFMLVLLRSRNVIEVCHRHEISNLTESTGLPTKRAEEERASKERSETRRAETSAREVQILDGCYPKATGWRNKRECIYLRLSISPKVRDISLLIIMRPWAGSRNSW